MKRTIKMFLFTAVFSIAVSIGNYTVCANTAENTVRVGLTSAFRQVSGVPIGNSSITLNKASGDSILNMGQLSSNSGYYIYTDNLYYLETNYIYSDFNSAYSKSKEIKAQGNKAVCVFSDGAWMVYTGGFSAENEALNYLNLGLGNKIIYPDNKAVRIDDGSEAVLLFTGEGGYPLIGSSEPVSIENKKYRGFIEPNRSLKSQIDIVNVVNIEDYLYAVVPSEMPSSWHLEALKAQTVSARSYTYTRMGIHQDLGYDLCDGEHCQVYKGYNNESESTNKAVNETKGLLAYYNGEIINATFFSSSGGATDDSENVWANKIGYLRGVPDPYDTEGKVWTRTFTLSEIDALLSSNNVNIGNAVSVAVTEVNAAGRVQKLTITGTAGQKVFEKEEVRTFFSGSKGGSLESRVFAIGTAPLFTETKTDSGIHILSKDGMVQKSPDALYKIDGNGNISKTGSEVNQFLGSKSAVNSVTSVLSASSGDTVIINGRGWGHGVGLSQYGAKSMGEAGFKFDEILKYYYTGIEIRQ